VLPLCRGAERWPLVTAYKDTVDERRGQRPPTSHYALSKPTLTYRYPIPNRNPHKPKNWCHLVMPGPGDNSGYCVLPDRRHVEFQIVERSVATGCEVLNTGSSNQQRWRGSVQTVAWLATSSATQTLLHSSALPRSASTQPTCCKWLALKIAR